MEEEKNIKKSIIDKYNIISFDIFDTLITRNLERPTDVFELVQLELDKRNIKYENFKEKRIQAEKIVRKESFNFEITFDEIYNKLKLNESLTKIEKIKQIELDIEENICQINYDFYDIYNYCVEKNKRIIITSDMYLPKKTIINILNKNKIKYEKLYLSSDINLTKSNGNIYKYILKDLKISPNELIHFGDNKKSDYMKPKKYGIASKLVSCKKNYAIKSKETNNLIYNAIQHFINNNIDNSKDYFWKLGYKIFGPLLYAYSVWLGKNFENRKYDNIFFLSRDGYIMKKAFDIINPNIKNKYIYASRRALIVPTLWINSNIKNLTETMFFSNHISIKAFFKKVGLDIRNYGEIIEKYGYTTNQIINIYEEINKEQFKNLYSNIEKDIYNNSKEEYRNLLNYLQRNNLNGKVAIVDIGWFGNMQKAINKIITIANIDCALEGYYIGIVPDSKNQDELIMNGFLFEKNKNEVLYYKKKFFNSIFEIVFLAHHGSVKRFGNSKIEFYDYEYKDSVTENNISEFQNGALQFVKDYNNYNFKKYIEIDPESSMQNFIEFGNSPTNEDIKKFLNLYFYDDDFYEIIPQHNIIYYIMKPRKFIEDFKNSVWKTGFLKKIFKININYFNIIMKLRKIYRERKN